MISRCGLFCSLYADPGSHYWVTSEAGKIDRDKPTQVRRALEQLGIELIAAYSSEAPGRSERMLDTLQGRLPQKLRLAGITDMAAANRFLAEAFLPEHNRRFREAPSEAGSAFVPWAGYREAPFQRSPRRRSRAGSCSPARRRADLARTNHGPGNNRGSWQ